MPILGTKKFWKPAIEASQTQEENQILKNSSYINIQLRTVNYMSKGNFWQNIFGGSNKIALSTSLKYQMGIDSVEATTVQDLREVKVNNNYNLGLQRNIAVKIPATAEALSMSVKMTAVHDDLLQAKFDMLNKPEYQSALQLAPIVVGQIVTITSLAKKLFTDSNPATQLEADYAGIISFQSESSPVGNGKLTKGLLIMISTNEGNSFTDIDESKFELHGDSLYYDGIEVENTYIIFYISSEQFKGEDEKSLWFKKYNDAFNNLDKIQLTNDSSEISKIYSDSKILWIEGNGLIDADLTYINNERIKIKATSLSKINQKYKDLTRPVSPESFNKDAQLTSSLLNSLTGSSSIYELKESLPATGSFIASKVDAINSSKKENQFTFKIPLDSEIALKILSDDSNEYINTLKKNRLVFQLGANSFSQKI